jgi:hypothetical protein
VKRGASNPRCHICSNWLSTLLNVFDWSESVSCPYGNAEQTLHFSSGRDLNTAPEGIGEVEVVNFRCVYRSQDILGFVAL